MFNNSTRVGQMLNYLDQDSIEMARNLNNLFESTFLLMPYIIGVPGGILNLTVFISLIFILKRYHHEEKPAFIFIANLALADLMFFVATYILVRLHQYASLTSSITR